MKKLKPNLLNLEMYSWSLFLDRDGIINKKIDNGYVTQLSEFEFIPGVLDDISSLTKIFSRIFVVTNQRGISKGLYSIDTLTEIHSHLLDMVNDSGGRIDRIYFCPHDYSDRCNCRKPNTGMALNAQSDFPEVDFNKSVMIGDSPSDIEMGAKLNMTTVLISNEGTGDGVPDFHFASLNQFAHFIKKTSPLKK